LVPAVALGAHFSAVAMRMTRSALLEVVRQDYIRTAYAKGLRERSVLVRHALKNALVPVVTILGVQFGYLLGGTVLIETIFSMPGLGRLTLDAITQRDYPQLQADVLVVAVMVVAVTLLVDLSYGWLDPRIRRA
jgi:peptide/nickel transport system permease protein